MTAIMLCLLIGLSQSVDDVALRDVRLLTEDGEVFAVETGRAVPGDAAAELVGTFDFASEPRGAAAGRLATPSLGVLWAIETPAGRLVTAAPDGYWIGVYAPAPVLEVLAFDEQTGRGTARVRVPVNRHGAGRFLYPALPPGASRVHLAIGPASELGVDESGAPRGARWASSIDVETSWPEVFVQVVDAEVAVGDASEAFVTLLEPAREERTIALASSPPGRVVIEPAVVTIAAGESAAAFGVIGRRRGGFRVEASEHGERVGSSVTTQVVASGPVFTVIDDLPSAGKPPPKKDARGKHPPDYGPGKQCVPGEGSSTAAHYVCGKCTSGTPWADCPAKPLAFWKPSRCVPVDDDESICFPAPPIEVESLKYEFEMSELVTCGTTAISAGVETGFKKVKAFLGGQQTQTLTKMCCKYRGITGVTKTIVIEGCQ